MAGAAGHDDDRDQRQPLPHPPQAVEPVHSRHPEIEYDESEFTALIHHVVRGIETVGRDDLGVRLQSLDVAFQRIPNHVVVVGEQNTHAKQS